MNLKTLGRWAGPALAAVVLNGLFFAFMPMLVGNQPQSTLDPPTGRLRIAAPESKKVVEPKRMKPKVPERPRTLRQKRVENKRPLPRKPPPPQPQLPEQSFRLNPRLKVGMRVQPPPPQPPKETPLVVETSLEAVVESDGLGAVGGEFELGEVDTAPRVLRRVNPVYPYSARRRQVTGKVVVKCLVDSEGRPTRLTIVETDPVGVFDESVLRALRKWRFKPGIYEGRSVATWVMVPFRFELRG